MRNFTKNIKNALTVLVACLFSVSLTGCGGIDGVDINLPVVGNIMKKTKKAETALVDRGKLLLPPKTSAAGALPAPGTNDMSAKNQAWPTDPDLRAKKMAELKKLKARKERENGNFKTYDGQEGFDRATDSFSRQEGVINKYYRKSKE